MPINRHPLFPSDVPFTTYALCSGPPHRRPIVFGLVQFVAEQPWRNAIYTSDPRTPQTSCILVEEGTISVVGARDDVEKFWGDHYPDSPLPTHFLNDQSIVVPGLTDAHAHTLQWGYMSQLPLAGSRSITEIVHRLETFVLTHPEVEADRNLWIRGMGWDQTRFEEGRWPTAEDFSASPVLAGRLIALQRVDLHATWVSQAVIDLLPNPLPISDSEIERRGGKVLRDNDGALPADGHESLGVFIDTAETLLPIPLPSLAQKTEWFNIAAKDALSVGLTGIHDAFIDHEDVDFYIKLADDGKLPVSLSFLDHNTTDEWPYLPRLRAYGPQGHLTLRSVKLFADGALGSFGAALLEPYSDDPSTSGLMRTPPEILAAQIHALYDRGWQVCTHAIGDRANKVVLDAHERIVNKLGLNTTSVHPLDVSLGTAGASAPQWRPRIEHAQIMRLEDVERIGRLGVIPSVQPTHATSDMGYAESRLGPERIKGAYAYADLLRNARDGVMPLGSDFPVENINPLLGFYAAVTRLDTLGNSPHGSEGWYREQRLTREEALRGMTSSPAYASFAENSYGTLRPGMKADFVVLDRNIMEVPVAEILETRVLATVIDGQIAFGSL
ncbi:amidohydrolase family-domain-containing protein [Vararia minispora EC-137]|uniref:Amidohydrolase family-domain-containing protein n=1 Tax=Vararia minispora EC-137 TaxID=1314806 RepID=A0ACB8QPS3_9AGAM|nr:amidohydrolase family-domain-containing protein [Vararia minispora EC-137]